MWGKIAFVLAIVFAVALADSRPKSCPVGSSYKIDCNTCTCGADAKADKCSQIDCSRASSASTAKPSNDRPGICPKVVAEVGNACATRDNKDLCKIDKDCGQAKKCCVDGCGKKLCRNAIYNYTR